MEENGKLFLLFECQLINVEGMKAIENPGNNHRSVCSDGSCQWMVKTSGWRFDEEHIDVLLENSLHNTNPSQRG